MVATLSARHTLELDVPRIRALAMLLPSLASQIRQITARLPIAMKMCDTSRMFMAHVERRCPELLLVDTDLVGGVGDLARVAHSIRRDVCVVGLACFWSEREEALRAALDGVLHKPPRAAEWEALTRGLCAFHAPASTASRPAPPDLAA